MKKCKKQTVSCDTCSNKNCEDVRELVEKNGCKFWTPKTICQKCNHEHCDACFCGDKFIKIDFVDKGEKE